MRTMGTRWTWVGILLAVALVLALPRLVHGDDDDEPYLRVYRAELTLEEPEAEPRGRFLLDLEVVCSHDESCRYTFEVQETAPRAHTVEVGELEIRDDGSIGAAIRWPVEEHDCGKTWSGRVRILAVPLEDGEPELQAEQHLAIRVPRRLCRRGDG